MSYDFAVYRQYDSPEVPEMFDGQGFRVDVYGCENRPFTQLHITIPIEEAQKIIREQELELEISMQSRWSGRNESVSVWVSPKFSGKLYTE